VEKLRLRRPIPICFRCLATLILVLAPWARASFAQEAPKKPAETSAEKKMEKGTAFEAVQNPAQIELLETKIRFEANGDSRKEVHARVHINTELGVRQFARLNFDYDRAFQNVEIPLVRITHPSGGTADILPSAISDNPNPAVVNAPAYQDVRVKSVRILGLAPDDTLEYRIITTVAHHPFAPDFYLTHDFSRGGIVTQEFFEIDLPAARKIFLRTSMEGRGYETEKSGEGDAALVIYKWRRPSLTPEANRSEETSASTKGITDLPVFSETDVALTTFPSWVEVLSALQKPFRTAASPFAGMKTRAEELTHNANAEEDKLRALYDFVSQKISTVDLPVGATGFRLRDPNEILSSGYATPEEKCILLSALAWQVGLQAAPAFIAPGMNARRGLATPSTLTNVLVVARFGAKSFWLDPSIEVAPFGMIASNLRGKPALLLHPSSDVQFFEDVSEDLPFAASQHVNVDATLAADGKLTAKVHYSVRGDNELLLRVAFHQAPKEKWVELAQLLSLSDGFRGKVTSVTAPDPYATRESFTIEYGLTQPKFVDWSKKPVRIPALLPQLGLPDPPAKPAVGAASSPIELGTPLEVETRATLHLPPGTTAQTPTGTSVQRDYATYASQYSVKGATITAARHINFILRKIPVDRAADYNAFLRAVQNDEAQDFTLDREPSPATGAKPAVPVTKSPAAPKP
jgi:hypothetical protein